MLWGLQVKPPLSTRVDEAEQKPRSGAGEIGLLPVCLPHAAFLVLIRKETLCFASSLFVHASVLVFLFSQHDERCSVVSKTTTSFSLK